MAVKPTQPAPIPAVRTPVPSRTDRLNFAVRADEFMSWFAPGTVGMNAAVAFINGMADYIAEQTSTSLAASNFKGRWSDLSGPLAMPASVLFNNRYWILLADLAAVEAKQPGVATEWAALDSYSAFAVDFLTSADATAARAKVAAAIIGTRTNWATQAGLSDQVAGLLAWRNFGNGHAIYDASKGLSPDGLTAVDVANASVPWAVNYPMLVGWNGTGTYGLKVDRARRAEELLPTNNYTISARLGFAVGSGTGYIQSNDVTWGMVSRPSVDGATASHLFTNSAGGALAYIDNTGKITSTTMQASTFIGTLSGSITGNSATANSASGASFLTGVGSSSSAFTVRLSGYADVSLFSDTTQWGLYSAAGGLVLAFNRGTGVATFNGNVAGTATAATNANYANSAGSASTAGYASNAGTVSSLSTGQVAVAYSAVGVFDVGSLIFAMIVSGSATVGNTVDGSQLRFADDNGDTNGTVFGGTWICRGHAPAGHSTLWQRIY